MLGFIQTTSFHFNTKKLEEKEMNKTIAITAVLVISMLTIVLASMALASDARGKSQTIAPAGSQPSSKGPSEFFTGNVRIDPIYPADSETNFSAAYVTFEPGARSHWHTHPCGQRLIVVSGVGLTGVWNGPVTEIKPGDVVTCPEGVKHWHGASATTAMTHIAMTGIKDGSAVTWMEPVNDQQYTSK